MRSSFVAKPRWSYLSAQVIKHCAMKTCGGVEVWHIGTRCRWGFQIRDPLPPFFLGRRTRLCVPQSWSGRYGLYSWHFSNKKLYTFNFPLCVLLVILDILDWHYLWKFVITKYLGGGAGHIATHIGRTTRCWLFATACWSVPNWPFSTSEAICTIHNLNSHYRVVI
jgi:hypothetical protein